MDFYTIHFLFTIRIYKIILPTNSQKSIENSLYKESTATCYDLCKNWYSSCLKTRCGSSMERLKGCGKKWNKKGITCIQGFVKSISHTNFTHMDVPDKYDLEQISCVNKGVDKYNWRLQNHIKVFEHTEVLKANLNRRGFTKRGEHVNAKGKELMAKRIAAAIKHTLKVREKTWNGKKIQVKKIKV